MSYFHLFLFGCIFFLSPLIFLLGIFTIFFIFIFFKIWENNLQKARYVHILQDYQNSIQNYESYIYRTLTRPMVIDVISVLIVVMRRIDGSLKPLRTLREVILFLNGHHILIIRQTSKNWIRGDRCTTSRLMDSRYVRLWSTHNGPNRHCGGIRMCPMNNKRWQQWWNHTRDRKSVV